MGEQSVIKNPTMNLSTFNYHLPPNLIPQTPLETRHAARLMVVERTTGSISHKQFIDLPNYLKSSDMLVANNSRVIPSQLSKVKDTVEAPLIDEERYQTVYSRIEGSMAAPSAGLHFSPEILLTLRKQGISLEYITLHIALDTFKLVEVENIQHHPIHGEWATLNADTAKRINQSKLAGRKLLAIGATTVRTLETAALRSAGITGSLQHLSQQQAELCPWKPVAAFEGNTDLFIYPGFKFKAIDMMLTNFHLPKSSLFMLVCAFAGINLMHQAYQEAIKQAYRFHCFGDAMLIL